MEIICTQSLCSEMKFFCSCKGELFLMCRHHSKQHKKYCTEKIMQICSVWQTRKFSSDVYIPFESTIKEITEHLKNISTKNESMDAFANGINLDGNLKC